MVSGSDIVSGNIVADTTGEEDSGGVDVVFFGCGCCGVWGLGG